MKRMYICDVIGDGSGPENAYRPSIATMPGVSVVSVIQPGQPWCLCLAAAPNHGPIRARQGVDPLPDAPLAVRWTAVSNADRNTLSAAMTRRGLPTSILTGADDMRSVVRGLGRLLDPTFNEDGFDVSEPA